MGDSTENSHSKILGPNLRKNLQIGPGVPAPSGADSGPRVRPIVGWGAGVALGAVGRILQDLARRGFMTAEDKLHGRKFLESGRLLDEWVVTYPTKLRPKLNPRRFRAPDSLWWKSARVEDLGALWGGEVAAALLTCGLKPGTQTIYVAPENFAPCLLELVRKHRLESDREGTIEILEAFWTVKNAEPMSRVVPPLLVYADLMASLNPRNLEIAGQIRKRFLENDQSKA